MSYQKGVWDISVIYILYEAYVSDHAKRDLMGIAKSIDPGQPAQSAQADHSQNFLLLADVQCI